MEDLPASNEEEKKKLAKIQDLIQKFNKVVEMSIQIFLPQIERAERAFKEGYEGESFLILSEVIELQMHHLWGYFLLHSTRKFKLHEESLGFKTYIEILWQIGYISSSQKSNLKAFQAGRNTIAHYASKHLQKGHPSYEILKDQFKKGLKISNELTNILKEKSPKFTFESK